eukprot:6684990-Karenia_brevis.AAC.1
MQFPNAAQPDISHALAPRCSICVASVAQANPLLHQSANLRQPNGKHWSAPLHADNLCDM